VGPCFWSDSKWRVGLCGSEDDWFSSVAISGAGSVIAAGVSNSTDGSFEGLSRGAQQRGGFTAVVDRAGEALLQRGSSFIQDVKAAPDGTVVAVGDALTGGAAATVTAFDGAGNTLWHTRVDQFTSFRGVDIGQDGSIVVWGVADVPGDPDLTHLVLAQFTPDGKLVWSKNYGDVRESIGMPAGVAVDADGIIYLVGSKEILGSSASDPSDAMVSKFSPQGDLVWTKTIGGDGLDRFQAAVIDPNGHVVAVGTTCSTYGDLSSGDTCTAVLVEISQNGNMESYWNYHSMFATEFFDIAATPDGGYAIVGEIGNDDKDAAVVKVRGLDELHGPDFFVWQKIFGGRGDDVFRSVGVDADGIIVAAGSTTSVDGSLPPSHGGMDAVMIRLSPNGDLMPL